MLSRGKRQKITMKTAQTCILNGGLALLVLISAAQAFVSLDMTSRSRIMMSRRRSPQSANLTGCTTTDFVVPVTIGSGAAAQTFNLIVDTGSSSLAVAGDNCCGVSPSYSTSLHAVNNASNTGQQASSTYGDGASWSANIWQDLVSVAGVSVANMNIAVQYSSTNFYMNSCGAGSQGIMGMGFSSLATRGSGGAITDSFPDAIENTGSSTGVLSGTAVAGGSNGGLVFAMVMCTTTGQLFLGADDHTGYGVATAQTAYVPLTQDVWYVINLQGMSVGSSTLSATFGTTVVDSGTSMMVLPQSAIDGLNGELNSNSFFQSNFGNNFITGSSCIYSYLSIDELNAQLPTLTFNLDDNTQLITPAISSYIIPYSYSNSVYFCPGVTASGGTTILGWSFMNNFLVVFDRTNTSFSSGAIGFAPITSCGTESGQVFVNGNPSATLFTSTPTPTPMPVR